MPSYTPKSTPHPPSLLADDTPRSSKADDEEQEPKINFGHGVTLKPSQWKDVNQVNTGEKGDSLFVGNFDTAIWGFDLPNRSVSGKPRKTVNSLKY